MARPTFREVTDALCMSAAELADLFGTSAQHIRQMRLDPGNRSARPAPSGWEAVLARLARDRGGELQKLADVLEQASATTD